MSAVTHNTKHKNALSGKW